MISTSKSDEWKWQDGVIVQKIGNEFMFVFPSTKGRIIATAKPTGRIQIGDTITILYSLKITRGDKARFIALNGSSVSQDLNLSLKVEQQESEFGFLIRDANQPVLHIHLNQNFLKDIAGTAQQRLNALQKRIAREGNMHVAVGSDKKFGFKITRVDIDY